MILPFLPIIFFTIQYISLLVSKHSSFADPPIFYTIILTYFLAALSSYILIPHRFRKPFFLSSARVSNLYFLVLRLSTLFVLLQVFIRGWIPWQRPFLYASWGVNPFSGLITLFILLLFSVLISGIYLSSAEERPKFISLFYKANILTLSIILFCLKRDLLFIQIISFACILLFYLRSSISRLIRFRINIILLFKISASVFLSSFLTLYSFKFVSVVRGFDASSFNTNPFQLILPYIYTPLLNTFYAINNGTIIPTYNILDFFLGYSSAGHFILTLLSSNFTNPADFYSLPFSNYNVFSGLLAFYSLSHSFFFIPLLFISSFILLLIFRRSGPQPWVISLIIIASLECFSHFLGSLTISLAIPVLILINNRLMHPLHADN